MAVNRHVVAYLRVSSLKQKEDGNSLETQRLQAIRYANQNNLSLSEEHIFEETKPASKKNNDTFEFTKSISARPELYKIIQLVSKRKVSDLIVASHDRLTRNTQEYRQLQIFMFKYDVTLHYAISGEKIDSSNDKMGRLIDFVLASISELEASLLASRTYDGNKKCVEEGFWPGGKQPYGYFLEPVQSIPKSKNTTIKANPQESPHIIEIYRMYTEYGYSYSKIATIMKEKYPSRVWNNWDVEYILKNRTYTGRIFWNRRGGRRNPRKKTDVISSRKIQGADIIDDHQWQKAQFIRTQKNTHKNPKYYSTPYLLKNKIFCTEDNPCSYISLLKDKATCKDIKKRIIYKKELVTKDYGKNKKKVYKCPSMDNMNCAKLIIERDLIDSKVINQLVNIVKFNHVENLWFMFAQTKNQRILQEQQLIHGLNNKIIELTIKLEKINNSLNEDFNNPSEDLIINELKNQLLQLKTNIEKNISLAKKEVDLCEERIRRLNIPKDDFFSCINNIFENISDINSANKRILIDILIDKVYVNNEENKVTIDIIFNPPENFLNFLTG